MAAINHHIRSCHGVNITVSKHLAPFLTHGIGARYFCLSAGEEETKTKMTMTKRKSSAQTQVYGKRSNGNKSGTGETHEQI